MRISDCSSDVCSSDLSAELRFDLDRLALVERGEGPPPRPGGADIHCAQRRPLAKSERYDIARETARHADDKRIIRIQHGGPIRTEERRVGKEGVGKSATRWAPVLSNKQ